VGVWWSVALAGGAVVISWLIGNRWTPAWLLSLGFQGLWAVYAVATQQWGFVASAVVFGTMNVRNYRKWRQLDREAARVG
jgi:hypothetical protein